MDLNLPDASGVDATVRILAASPDVRVLMMTMSADDDAVVAAMRAGARGYVVKGAGRDELLHAIRTVAAGGAVFSPTVADRLGRFFTGLATGGGREAFPQLTSRELEVLDLVARGLENRRIARELHLSDKTVRNHVSNVMAKLDVEDRSAAIARARAAGLRELSQCALSRRLGASTCRSPTTSEHDHATVSSIDCIRLFRGLQQPQSSRNIEPTADRMTAAPAIAVASAELGPHPLRHEAGDEPNAGTNRTASSQPGRPAAEQREQAAPMTAPTAAPPGRSRSATSRSTAPAGRSPRRRPPGTSWRRWR